MSSQSEDHQNKRDQPNHPSSTSSDTNNNHQPPPPPPPPPPNNHSSPPPGYPPTTMGYPPQMMYPNAPYPGYPPPHPNPYNQYPYTQPPPASYYNQGYAAPRPDPCAGFLRGIIAVMIFLIAFSLLSSLITWAVLRPEAPVLRVDNMSVSNFSTSSVPFTATWDTNLTVENSNQKLRVYFDKILGTMFHDEEDNLLGASWLNPMFMDVQTKTTMHAMIFSNGSAENPVPIWVAQEMSKERGTTGAVKFSLRFRIWATFKVGSWWTRSLLLKVECDDLKVNFVGASGNGALVPGKHDDCEVYA